jgi:RimJ/RimL family protein N-acetyltransferase
VWEGTLRHDRRDAAGALRSTRVYALLRDQWEGGRQ